MGLSRVEAAVESTPLLRSKCNNKLYYFVLSRILKAALFKYFKCCHKWHFSILFSEVNVYLLVFLTFSFYVAWDLQKNIKKSDMKMFSLVPYAMMDARNILGIKLYKIVYNILDKVIR